MSTLEPFKSRLGFNANRERGINFADPVLPQDAATRQWVEEAIANGSRIRGEFIPDTDGLGEPSPDLDALVGGVDVLTADYWVTSRIGVPSSGPAAYRVMIPGDNLIATVSPRTVTSFTLNGGLPITGLLPNRVLRFEPQDPAYTGEGQGLGLLLFVDGTGLVVANSLSNPGFGYRAGEVLNATIPNNFINAVGAFSTYTPSGITLEPSTVYYDVDVSGGTGGGVTLSIVTDATGQGIATVRVYGRGAGYTVGDVLTLTIRGQAFGAYTVGSVYTGTDVATTVEIDTIGPGVGWTFTTGGGLNRDQANLEYLRLDGGNVPTNTLDFNNQWITNLRDGVQPQDAVTFGQLDASAKGVYDIATQAAHGFTTGQQVYKDAAGVWQLAIGTAANTLRQGTVGGVINADSFYVVMLGIMNWPAHGLTVGETYYLSTAVAGEVVTPPVQVSGLYQQAAFDVIDANTVKVLDQAVVAW